MTFALLPTKVQTRSSSLTSVQSPEGSSMALAARSSCSLVVSTWHSISSHLPWHFGQDFVCLSLAFDALGFMPSPFSFTVAG